MDNEQLEKLKMAQVNWDEAFIASPWGKRCLCIPFNASLNEKYEESIRLQKEMSSLFSLIVEG